MTKKMWIKGLLVLAGVFVVLFMFRLGYGYVTHPAYEASGGQTINNDYGYSQFELGKRNYASVKMGQAQTPVDQKYEKVASLVAQSRQFQEDEKSVRDLIHQHGALVQFEQSHGLAGSRVLNLGVGVVPEKFDLFVNELGEIGKRVSIRIDKADKTNEYKGLNAKRISLTKTRDALIALKGRNGDIEGMIALENRILDIEQQIQNLGVDLGEYDEENEFCTVKLTLTESALSRDIPFMQRLKVALEWTVSVYLGLMASAFFAGLALMVFLPLMDRLLGFLRKWKIIPVA